MNDTKNQTSKCSVDKWAWIASTATLVCSVGLGIWQACQTNKPVVIHVTEQSFFSLWLHNASLVFVLLLGVLSLGAVSWFVMLWNGINFGYYALSVVRQYGVMVALGGILPHGIFEIPSILLAFQADITLITALLRIAMRPFSKNEQSTYYSRTLLYSIAIRNLLALAFLGLAAGVESFLTPTIVEWLLY